MTTHSISIWPRAVCIDIIIQMNAIIMITMRLYMNVVCMLLQLQVAHEGCSRFSINAIQFIYTYEINRLNSIICMLLLCVFAFGVTA